MTGLLRRLLGSDDSRPEPAHPSLASATMNRWAMAAAVRYMAAAAAAACLVSIAALAVAVWALTRPSDHRYFATRADGELVQLTPLDEPHLGDAQVRNFAVEALTRSFSVDFANYRQDLSDVAKYFTGDGYQAFLAEMESSGNLELILNRRMVASAVANGAVVLQQGLLGTTGVYAWHVEVPLTVTYQSSSERRTQRVTMHAEVRRVPTWTSDWGVAVARIVGQSVR